MYAVLKNTKEERNLLQLFVDKVNVGQISKILVKYNIKATIKDSTITIYGTIPEDLASQLYSNTHIIAFNNYDDGQGYSSIEAPTASGNVINADMFSETRPDITEETTVDEVVTYNNSNATENSKFLLRYPKVKRAEVYLCNFGETLEHEQAGKRYAIIIQNDDGNQYSPNTIVLPLTTQHKPNLPVHYIFKFSSENMVDYSNAKVSEKNNVALGEAITTISKSRLIKYLGTMTEDFIDEKIQPIIDRSLGLKRKTETVTVSKPEVKTVIRTKTVYVEKDSDAVQMAIATYRDLNLAQIQLLSFVDINELISISKTLATDREKAYKILQLFGFDFSENGVPYLLDAICISPKSKYFNLETLSKKLYETGKYTIEELEIQRLIVARVKEKFRFKKSPTIDFIRLVNRLLTKKEEKQDDENSI